MLKYNRWFLKQSRVLLLTNSRIYNLKGDKIQRKIAVSSIRGLTRSTKSGNLEFVVHVKDEYDYRFESEYRAEIFDAIKYTFWKTSGRNVPVFGVDDSLKHCHTSKRDVQEGNVVMPEQKFRRPEEDVYPED